MDKLLREVVQYKLNDKSYCGNKCQIPQGYTRMGTRYECLRKGVSIGKNMEISPRSFVKDLLMYYNP